MTLTDILQRLDGVHGAGTQYVARCPVHGDSKPSLSIGQGQDGRVLLKCHAGCDTADILDALGLQTSDLFPETAPGQAFHPVAPQGKQWREATYDYRDETGAATLRKVKMRHPDGGKHFYWLHLDGNEWKKGRGGRNPALYTSGIDGAAVLLVEGEKDVDSLKALNWPAATTPDGAGGKWQLRYTDELSGKEVAILPDNDEPGRKFAETAAAALFGHAASVRIADLRKLWPDMPEHGDITDYLTSGHAWEPVVELIISTPPMEEAPDVGAEPGNDGGFVGFVGFDTTPFSENPTFPAEELSDILRNMAVGISESLQVAVDMPAAALLTVAAICAQKKFVINPKPGWIEPVNLYTAIVALPSERKSPVLSKVMVPVHAFTRAENERRRPIIEEYATKKDILERRIENMKKATASVGKKGAAPVTSDDVTMLQRELSDLERDAVDYINLVSDDTTTEVLALNMEKNGEKMGLVSSEGGIFNTLAGLYSGGIANFDIFLKSYSGDYYKSSRMTRAKVELTEPALTVLLMVQQSVLEAIMQNNEFKGRGLLARFLYSIPDSLVGHRSYDTGDVPEEFAAEYNNLVVSLLSLPDGEPRILHLDHDAQTEARKLFFELEPRLRDDLEPLGDWAGKHHGRVMRIAALLHICDHGADAASILIPGETIRRARVIGDYFIEHAKAAYRIMGLSENQATKDAKYILKRLDSTGLTEISKRDLYRLCMDRVGFEKAAYMEPGLKVLVDRGFIKIEKAHMTKPTKPTKGGRPSLMVYVNPEYRKEAFP